MTADREHAELKQCGLCAQFGHTTDEHAAEKGTGPADCRCGHSAANHGLGDPYGASLRPCTICPCGDLHNLHVRRQENPMDTTNLPHVPHTPTIPAGVDPLWHVVWSYLHQNQPKRAADASQQAIDLARLIRDAGLATPGGSDA